MKQIKINLNGDLPRGTIALSIINTARENKLPLYLDEERIIVYGPLASAEFIEKFFGKIEEESDE